MKNLLTTTNLQAGIRLWHWDRDFHNEYYQQLSRWKQNGLNEAWWWQIVDELAKWKATRGQTKHQIGVRGVERLKRLQAPYNQIIGSTAGRPLNLTTATWQPLEELYSVAFDIKHIDSPVFGSKLCHFILPNAFPVFDHAVIGDSLRSIGVHIHTYEEYWRFCKAQWTECSEQEALRQEMQLAIGKAVHADYPYSTKVTELCISSIPKKSACR